MNATTTARPVTHTFPQTTGWDGLSVEREDIRFTTPTPGLLAVELTVRNAGDTPTAPALGVLQSAPLGAFVPWQPLDVVQVPALGPGESAVIQQQYRFSPPKVLGGADRLPPDRLLVALGLGEPDRPGGSRPRRSWLGRAAAAALGMVVPRTGGGPTPALAPDVMAHLGLGSLYWAGNLNLFFPHHDVERHSAQALRIYPGRVNLAMFVVGSGTADQYKFELSGESVAWNARLYDTLVGLPIGSGVNRGPALREGKWYRPTTGLYLLAIEPPATAEAGAVNVHVRQRSSRREAVVEFTMDAHAAGPGCYKL